MLADSAIDVYQLSSGLKIKQYMTPLLCNHDVVLRGTCPLSYQFLLLIFLRILYHEFINPIPLQLFTCLLSLLLYTDLTFVIDQRWGITEDVQHMLRKLRNLRLNDMSKNFISSEFTLFTPGAFQFLCFVARFSIRNVVGQLLLY